MRGEERREKIICMLKESSHPIKGGDLSKLLNVSRQVIVQDIALLRAEGSEIIATPQGYVFLGGAANKVRKVIAVRHGEEGIEGELKTIISLGGVVLDVTIEHRIYGEITGKLMLKSHFDVDEFIRKVKLEGSKPLSHLTGGVHIHTIEADSEEAIERIIGALGEKGYLVNS